MNGVNVDGFLTAAKWAAKRVRDTLKAETMLGYKQMYARLQEEERIPGSSKKPSSRQYERAAARRMLANEILEGVKNNDDVAVAEAWVRVQQIQDLADANMQAYEDGEWTGARQQRNSKKASIKNLDADWRERVCEAFVSHKYLNAVRILACVGCRPAELQIGVQVYRETNGILFIINGAKLAKNKGQSWREILLPLDHPIASQLAEKVHRITKKDKKLLTDTIGRYSAKLGFVGISAYSFRHQFASDLKASGFKKSEIAKSLGHQSVLTQQTYGNKGAGSAIVVTVHADQEPRSEVKNKINNVSNKKPKPM